MVEAGSNAYIRVPWLAAAARVALGAAAHGAQHDSARLGGLTTVLFGELLVVLGSDLRI